MFLNPKKTAEHGRFDAAHELGHLAMHTHTVPRNREAELEADRFASAFLMPRGDVFGHVPPPVTDGYAHDYPFYKGLVDRTADSGFKMKEVSADRGYLGATNMLATLQL